MTTVQNILDFLETVAPASLKMEWDNVGLLCGSKDTPVTKILVALDPFQNVCQEAVDLGAQLLLTHHPLIFTAPRAITDETSMGRSIQLLCANGICAANAHTNLDCAEGGVNDVLAQTLGLESITPIVSPEGTLLRHGYVEEQLLCNFLCHIKEKLHCKGLRFVAGGTPVHHVAVGGGSCGSELMDAYKAGCDTFVTSDIKYNQFQDAIDLGMNLIDAGHFATENPVMSVLAEKIRAKFPEIQVKISETNCDHINFF